MSETHICEMKTSLPPDYTKTEECTEDAVALVKPGAWPERWVCQSHLNAILAACIPQIITRLPACTYTEEKECENRKRFRSPVA
jgi:hypothetical protein